MPYAVLNYGNQNRTSEVYAQDQQLAARYAEALARHQEINAQGIAQGVAGFGSGIAHGIDTITGAIEKKNERDFQASQQNRGEAFQLQKMDLENRQANYRQEAAQAWSLGFDSPDQMHQAYQQAVADPNSGVTDGASFHGWALGKMEAAKANITDPVELDAWTKRQTAAEQIKEQFDQKHQQAELQRQIATQDIQAQMRDEQQAFQRAPAALQRELAPAIATVRKLETQQATGQYDTLNAEETAQALKVARARKDQLFQQVPAQAVRTQADLEASGQITAMTGVPGAYWVQKHDGSMDIAALPAHVIAQQAADKRRADPAAYEQEFQTHFKMFGGRQWVGNPDSYGNLKWEPVESKDDEQTHRLLGELYIKGGHEDPSAPGSVVRPSAQELADAASAIKQAAVILKGNAGGGANSQPTSQPAGASRFQKFQIEPIDPRQPESYPARSPQNVAKGTQIIADVQSRNPGRNPDQWSQEDFELYRWADWAVNGIK